LSAVGEREEALAAITEAVGHYRELAEADPGAFLPDLARSLSDQAEMLSVTGLGDDYPRLFEATAAALPSPSARAWLRAGYSESIATSDPGAARRLLMAAAAEVAAEVDDPPTLLGQCRRHVRDAAQLLLASSADLDLAALPSWARDPIDDASLALLQEWSAVPDWSAEASFLRAHSTIVMGRGFRATLAQEIALNPEDVTLQLRRSHLAAIEELGLEEALRAIADAQYRADRFQEWVASPDWATSEDRFNADRDLLEDSATRALLEKDADDPVVAQHLAILDLAGSLPVADVFDVVRSVAVAGEMLLRFVADGHFDDMQNVTVANPGLLQAPFYGPLIIASLASLAGDTQTAEKLVEMAVQQAEQYQRLLAASSLRTLARRDVDRTGNWDHLADVLAPPSD
jgi:hypothetical protein